MNNKKSFNPILNSSNFKDNTKMEYAYSDYIVEESSSTTYDYDYHDLYINEGIVKVEAFPFLTKDGIKFNKVVFPRSFRSADCYLFSYGEPRHIEVPIESDLFEKNKAVFWGLRLEPLSIKKAKCSITFTYDEESTLLFYLEKFLQNSNNLALDKKGKIDIVFKGKPLENDTKKKVKDVLKEYDFKDVKFTEAKFKEYKPVNFVEKNRQLLNNLLGKIIFIPDEIRDYLLKEISGYLNEYLSKVEKEKPKLDFNRKNKITLDPNLISDAEVFLSIRLEKFNMFHRNKIDFLSELGIYRSILLGENKQEVIGDDNIKNIIINISKEKEKYSSKDKRTILRYTNQLLSDAELLCMKSIKNGNNKTDLSFDRMISLSSLRKELDSYLDDIKNGKLREDKIDQSRNLDLYYSEKKDSFTSTLIDDVDKQIIELIRSSDKTSNNDFSVGINKLVGELDDYSKEDSDYKDIFKSLSNCLKLIDKDESNDSSFKDTVESLFVRDIVSKIKDNNFTSNEQNYVFNYLSMILSDSFNIFNKKDSLKGIDEERAILHRKMAAMSLEIDQFIKDKNKYIGFYKQVEDIHSNDGKVR